MANEPVTVVRQERLDTKHTRGIIHLSNGCWIEDDPRPSRRRGDARYRLYRPGQANPDERTPARAKLLGSSNNLRQLLDDAAALSAKAPRPPVKQRAEQRKRRRQPPPPARKLKQVPVPQLPGCYFCCPQDAAVRVRFGPPSVLDGETRDYCATHAEQVLTQPGATAVGQLHAASSLGLDTEAP